MIFRRIFDKKGNFPKNILKNIENNIYIDLTFDNCFGRIYKVYNAINKSFVKERFYGTLE